MAKIVVAGASDCPYYAKIELLADELQRNLPYFNIYKIVKTRKEWSEWIRDIAEDNQWKVKESPVIWRELVDRGGKGHLIGGPNDFQEYIRCYYNLKSDLTTGKIYEIAKDNIRFKEELDKENREFKALSTPEKICICGATNRAVPHFILELGKGQVIGENVELSIVFQDYKSEIEALKGLQMGTMDLAFPLIRSISITDDMEAAIADSKVVVIFESVNINKFILRHGNSLDKNWRHEIQEYYEAIGNTIEKFASHDSRILVVPTSPLSPLALELTAIHHMLNRKPRFSVIGLALPWVQRARSVLAEKLSVLPSNVSDIIVWGNVTGVNYVDISRSRVRKYDGAIVGPDPFTLSVPVTIKDKKWKKEKKLNSLTLMRENEFLNFILMSGKVNEDDNIVKDSMLCEGGTLSLSRSTCKMIQLWLDGDEAGHIYSAMVAAEGLYGLPTTLVFCLPIKMGPKGYWKVVENIELDEEQYRIIKDCEKELIKRLQINYPWMNQSNQDMVLDDRILECQIKSILDEIEPTINKTDTWQLLKRSLDDEELFAISRSKKMLSETLDKLRYVPSDMETDDRSTSMSSMSSSLGKEE